MLPKKIQIFVPCITLKMAAIVDFWVYMFKVVELCYR